MFDLSVNNKNESIESGSDKQNAANFMESLEQNIINCPALMTLMSREMRNQMNAIVAFAYLLNKKEYNEEEKEEFSNQIYDSCEQMISLFDNFVDSAIIDAGSSGPEPKIFNPDKTFNELFSEFREVLGRVKYKDILFVTENQSFKNTEYLIDTNRITRVIRNLFQNALSNTKSGYIKVGYYLRNEKLTFYILDSGQGYIKCREFLQTRNLTESLSRFNDAYSAVNLTLTRKLIEMMDGSVWIECNGLTGSGIYFSIPAATVNTEDITNKYLNTVITI
jgi:signal transduction histidine kinase